MKTFRKKFYLLGLLALGSLLAAPCSHAQTGAVTKSTASATLNDLTADLHVPSGKSLTLKSGGTFDASVGTLTLAANQIAWAKVDKTGSSLADLSTRLFADLQSKPTTIAGYAITDPIVLTSGSYADPAWITALGATKLTGTVPTGRLYTTAAGYNIATGAALDALGAVATPGGLHRTAANTYAARTLTGTAGQITVTNGDGVSGNPTISLPATITQATTFSGLTASGNLTFGTSASVLSGTTGSIGLTATGTNQSISLTPTGTGIISLLRTSADAILQQESNTSGQAISNLYGFNTSTNPATASGGGGAAVVLRNKSATNGNFSYIGAQTSAAAASSGIAFVTDDHTTPGGHLQFLTRLSGSVLSEKARLSGSGNLLLGTTTDSGARLNVSGTIDSTGVISSTGSNAGLQLYDRTGGLSEAWLVSATGSSLLSFVNSGNTNLSVNKTGAVTARSSVTGTALAAVNATADSNSNLTLTNDVRSWIVGVKGSGGAADHLYFRDSSGGADYFTMAHSTGNAAFLSTTPTTNTSTGALTVAGGGAFLGNLAFGGQLIVGHASEIQVRDNTGTANTRGISGLSYARLADSSAALPAFGFNSDPDNGMYLLGANSIGFSTAGLRAVGIDANQNTSFSGDVRPFTNNTFDLGSTSVRWRGLWVQGVSEMGAINSSSSILSTHGTNGIGYGTGAGGTIAQATSRTTGVTLSKVSGTITTHTASLAAGASASFTVTNTAVAISDVVVLSIRSGQTNKQTRAAITAVAAGTFEITVTNHHASVAETGAIIINFAVIKAVTS